MLDGALFKRLGALLACLGLAGASASAQYAGGAGAPADPYLIATAEQMQAIGAHPQHWSAHFKLTADLDLSAYDGRDGRPAFNIIGPDWSHRFFGVFDGNGHTLRRFTWSSPGRNYTALFGCIYGANAAVCNLTLLDPNVAAGTGDCAAALVGYLQLGTVADCSVRGGAVRGDWQVASLVAYLDQGLITRCYADAAVAGDGQDAGGLVGFNNLGQISQCLATGPVAGNRCVGGLAGRSYAGWIHACRAAAAVQGDQEVGGLLGRNEPNSASVQVADCCAAGAVQGQSKLGGLVGRNVGRIARCYSTGSVSGQTLLGGLIGVNAGSVSGSFWDIQTSGLDSSAAGQGIPTALMQTRGAFLDAGWSFVDDCSGAAGAWRLCRQGAEYPWLAWQSHPGDRLCPEGVDLADFSLLAAAWLSDLGQPSWNPACDLAPNDRIDVADLATLLAHWALGPAR